MNVSGISGRLTSDVELKTTNSGKSVVSFTVAVKRPGAKDAVDFIDCVAWDDKAEFVCKYFKKGSRIEVSGSLNTRVFGKDGSRRKVTEINCLYVQFGENKRENSNDSTTGQSDVSGNDFTEADIDEELPF